LILESESRENLSYLIDSRMGRGEMRKRRRRRRKRG